MFNTLFAEETGQKVPDENAEAGAEGTGDQPSTSTGAGTSILSFWSVAAAVTSTVKARADELVKSVVDTDWRNELSTFSHGVGEESKVLKEETAKLVEHLPEQIMDLPEKAAQAQIKEMGQTLEGVSAAFATLGKTLFQGTQELIAELREGVDTEITAAAREGKRAARGKAGNASTSKLASVQAKYNRFEAEVAAMQRDSSTYCDEPEDAEDFARWRSGFSLDAVKADIAKLTADNAFMGELHSRLVPIIVEDDDFWSRYFYRLHKLQQKEEQRQQLAQRAKNLQEDEVPLGWGDEDDTPAASEQPQAVAPAEAAAAAPAAAPEAAPAAPEASAKGASKAAGKATGLAASTSAPKATPSAEAKPAAVAPAPAPEPKQEAHTPAPAPAPAPEPAAEPGPSAAASAAPEAAVEAEAQAEPAGPAATASPPAEAPPGRSSAGHSGGGASGSTADEGVHVEAEPHAETASDSSAKEWCVVDSKPSTSGGGAAPAGPAAESSRGPVSGESSSGSPAGGGADESEAPAGAAASASAEPAEAEGKTEDAGAEDWASPVKEPAPKKAEAAKAAGGSAAKAAPHGKPAGGKGDDEEVDEDWGNWD
ncbi:hypothetical protein HYH03_009392 [Edaphochlamys debaryana]|uniref:BSD domain-containing protein n=1 Tax=Edaphochlamys debaryana TaxID=47281 RepID=A0A835XYT3_9CHLO|nr:hypothetical protein HYH03_009392 [Edaphochlamys debaryana]|eukprot:KAG2492450.1 hypothetical protein HYH03_009392 [Edaphochlamys debaryana]